MKTKLHPLLQFLRTLPSTHLRDFPGVITSPLYTYYDSHTEAYLIPKGVDLISRNRQTWDISTLYTLWEWGGATRHDNTLLYQDRRALRVNDFVFDLLTS